MRRLTCVLLALSLLAALSGCAQKTDPVIEEAIDELKEAWEDEYRESDIDSSYLEIVHTRVITLEDDAGEEWEGFEGISAIIEFQLLSDYFGEDSIPMNVGYLNCVVVDEDGDMEVVSRNPLDLYRSAYFRTDYSDIVKSVENLGSTYDRVLDLGE